MRNRYESAERALFPVLNKKLATSETNWYAGFGERQAFREYYILSRRILNSEIYLGPVNFSYSTARLSSRGRFPSYVLEGNPDGASFEASY